MIAPPPEPPREKGNRSQRMLPGSAPPTSVHDVSLHAFQRMLNIGRWLGLQTTPVPTAVDIVVRRLHKSAYAE